MLFWDSDPILYNFLATHNITYSYYEHPPLFTVEDSEKYGIEIPWAHTKNLFLTDKKWWYYLFSVEWSKRVALNQFRKQLWVKELSFWSPEDLSIYLGLTPWSVSIMGLLTWKDRVQFYIDEDLRAAEYIWVHPNRNDATIVLAHAELARFLEIIWVTPNVVKVPVIENK
jgi:Ala-tRNA(Pro) deacylase